MSAKWSVPTDCYNPRGRAYRVGGSAPTDRGTPPLIPILYHKSEGLSSPVAKKKSAEGIDKSRQVWYKECMEKHEHKAEARDRKWRKRVYGMRVTGKGLVRQQNELNHKRLAEKQAKQGA